MPKAFGILAALSVSKVASFSPKKLPISNFELGSDNDYTIYKLWRYVGNFPLELK